MYVVMKTYMYDTEYECHCYRMRLEAINKWKQMLQEEIDFVKEEVLEPIVDKYSEYDVEVYHTDKRDMYDESARISIFEAKED